MPTFEVMYDDIEGWSNHILDFVDKNRKNKSCFINLKTKNLEKLKNMLPSDVKMDIWLTDDLRSKVEILY